MISSIEDRLLKEVLSDTPEDDRETLINVCREYYIPNKMYFVDFVVFISALTKMGRLDIHGLDTEDIFVYEGTNVCVNLNDDSRCTFCKDGRIIKLVFHAEIIDDEELEFDVPAIVGRLENLKDLQVMGCRSIPAWELSKLPQLETLHISACSLELDNNFPILQHLKKLQVDSFHFESTSDPFFQWMTSQLPSVEEIKFYGDYDYDRESTDAILDFLSSIEDTSFKDNLKVLSMERCGLNDNDFKTIMSKIRPKFNNLVEIDLRWNNIQTVQHTVNEIKNIKSLRVLNLNWNPILRKMEKDPEERKVMLSFLKINNTLHNIGGPYYGPYYDPEIEYALRINTAGRSIIEGSASGSGGRSLPLSMWPTVLERAYYANYFKSRSKSRSADGVYYLLRNGLFGSLNYGGGNGNSNGGGSDNSKRKRK